MKYLLLAIGILLLTSGSPTKDQVEDATLLTIEKAFQSADAEQLSVYFSEPIELVFDNSFDIYSKKQAELVLKDFFKSHDVSQFHFTYIRQKNEAEYGIGVFPSGNNTYRVYILIKQVGSERLIRHLRIDLQSAED